MRRAGALALAVLVVVAIFGLTLLAVHWFFGTPALWSTVHARWFPVALIISNSVTFSAFAVVALIRQRHAEKRAQAEETGLLSASERFRQERGKSKL